METNQQAWTLLGRPSGRNHHRYFQAADGRVSVADNSGRDPDFTDDGPLYLDTTRAARVECLQVSGVVVRLPVRTRDGARANCFVQPGDLVFLLDRGHWHAAAVEVSAEIKPLAYLFSALMAPAILPAT